MLLLDRTEKRTSSVRVRRLTRRIGRKDRRAFWRSLPPSPWRACLESDGLTAGNFSRGWLEGATIFAWGPPIWVFSGQGGEGQLFRPREDPSYFDLGDPLTTLRNLLSRLEPDDADKFPFRGGAVGYWGYESANYFDRGKKKALIPPREIPDFMWVLPSFFAVIDGEQWSFFHQTEDATEAASMKLLENWSRQAAGLPEESKPALSAEPAGLSIESSGRLSYIEGVRRIRRYIAAGDIYQANLSREIELPWPQDRAPHELFDVLNTLNPSPYSALFEVPDFSLVSCSPELLVRVRGSEVETRPIAGTRPRGRSRREDDALSGELLLSGKERAEHIMLVDLERNDLGRVCRPGSVRVTERMAIEKYSHVIHIVSHVRGLLQNDRDGFDAVRALFPGGTITGCPKIRCMEILAELERGPRGPFFGSAGWIGPEGNMELNILIRTALLRQGKMKLRVGAGIVADSLPNKEYDETHFKAGALLTAHRAVLSRPAGSIS